MDGRLARIALVLTRVAERWLPDAFVFALAATVLVFVAGLASAAAPLELVARLGQRLLGAAHLHHADGAGHRHRLRGRHGAAGVPRHRRARRRAPDSPRGAVALVAAFAMASSWLNWGFSLIFSAVLAREVARRRARGVDYRALGAAQPPRPRQRLGAGALRLGRAADGDARRAAAERCAPSSRRRRGPRRRSIAFSHTIFLWQSLASVAIEIVVVTAGHVAGRADGRARATRPRSASTSARRSTLAADEPPRAHARRAPRALAAAHAARRRARRRLPRAHASPAACTDAHPQHHQPRAAARSAARCTARRRA